MSLIQRFPSDQAVYLLLDGAQFESTEKWLYSHSSSPSFHLVYESTDLANARDVSPCLVELNQPGNAHLADQFSALASAHQAGIVLATHPDVSLKTLLDHLQSLLYASCELTAKAVFRWYDPRVCQQLLKSSSSSEQAELLGPVKNLLISTSDGWVEFINATVQQRSNNPYRLSEHQLAALNNATEQVFQQRLHLHLTNYYPDVMAHKTTTEQYQLCKDWTEKGKQLGFEDQLSLTLFCNILAMLGLTCLEAHSPYPSISKLLLQKSAQTPQQRVAQAAELAANIVTTEQTPPLNPTSREQGSHA